MTHIGWPGATFFFQVVQPRDSSLFPENALLHQSIRCTEDPARGTFYSQVPFLFTALGSEGLPGPAVLEHWTVCSDLRTAANRVLPREHVPVC